MLRRRRHPITPPGVDWLAIAPELALGGAARARSCWRKALAAPPARGRRRVAYSLAAVGVITAGAMLFWQWSDVQRRRPDHHHGGHGARRRVRRVPRRGRRQSPPRSRCSSRSATCSARSLETTRVLRADAVLGVGMLMMTTANDLIVVFLSLEMLSIPLYVLSAFDRRRLARRKPASSTSCSARSRRRSSSTASRSSTAPPAPRRSPASSTFLAQNTLFEQGTLLAGLGLLLVGPRVQGLGGAVPHVDARRVPGLAHAGHRVHGRGHEGRRRSPRCCACSGRVPARTATTGARWCGCSPCSRSLVGSIAAVLPDRHEAHARVLVDRARRLRADGVPGGHARRAARPRCSTSSSTRSW